MESVWYVFGSIGMVVVGITTILALVWVTSFVVRMLIKTFSHSVNEYVTAEKEHITKKQEARKVRLERTREKENEIKDKKLEIKLSNMERIANLKNEKEAIKQASKENKIKESIAVLKGEKLDTESVKSSEKVEPSKEENSITTEEK